MTQAQAHAADPKISAWVGASAGTGKTKVLTDRVLRLLLEGVNPGRLLCLTYTKAAAAEMKNRIHSRLSQWTVMPDAALESHLKTLTQQVITPEKLSIARQLFTRVLDTPDGIKIQTIHAFCQMLIRRFPVEADVPPHFQVMDETESKEWMNQARHELLSGKLGQEDEALKEILDYFTWKIDDGRFENLLQSILQDWKKLQLCKEQYGDIDAIRYQLFQAFEIEPQSLDDFWQSWLDAPALDEAALRDAVQAWQASGKEDNKRAENLAAWLMQPLAARIVHYSDYARLFFSSKGEPLARLFSKAVKENFPDSAAFLLKEQERVVRMIAQFKTVNSIHETAKLLYVANAILTRYQHIKNMHVRLDYQDLVHKAIRLLCESNSAQWVLYKLDGGIDHILIDEAQDTSPEQWRVAKALCDEFFSGQAAREENRTLFVVGDEKQSIYSFQGADPDAFDDMHHELKAKCMAADKTWKTVPLERSFRSTQAVLDAVDEVFSQGELKAAVTKSEQPIKHEAHRAGEAGRVEIWPLVAPAKTEKMAWPLPCDAIETKSATSLLANQIAETIASWLKEKRLLPSKGRPIEPGDILILLQKRSQLANHINKALKAHHIPVAGEDRLVVTEHLAVKDLMAAARFVLLPEDDLTLAIVLKSPLIAMSEEALMQLAVKRGEKSLWEMLRLKQAEPEYRQAFTLLSDWLKRADFLTPFELFSHMLEASGGRERFIARLGIQIEDPVNEFLQQILQFEQSHIPTLQQALKWLEAGELTIKRDMEQGANEVRVMTAHGSKGLQAPIVFLADAHVYDRGMKDGDQLLWMYRGEEAALPMWLTNKQEMPPALLDMQQVQIYRKWQEYYRLLYVAMTRAEDELYITGIGENPDAEEQEEGVAKKSSEKQGKSKKEQSWYHVVKRALEPLATPQSDQKLVIATGKEKEVNSAVFQAKSTDVENKIFPAWLQQAAPKEPTPPKPLSPSQLSEQEEMQAITTPLQSKSLKRGQWIHTLLQHLPELAVAKREHAARSYLTTMGLSDKESDEITAKLMEILTSDSFGALFQKGSKAEVPIVGNVGKFIVSGQIDRLYIGKEHILLVDYKTNRTPPHVMEATPSAYLKQMAAYRQLLKEIYPDKEIKTALLWVQIPRLMPLSEGLLEKYIPTSYIKQTDSLGSGRTSQNHVSAFS